MDPADTGKRVNEMNPGDIGEMLQEVDPADIGERLTEMNPDVIEERLLGRNPEGIAESLNEMNPDVIGEMLQEVDPADIGQRLTEMNPDVERLLGRNPKGIGERLNEMNPDAIGERLLGRNPEGIGERLNEMNPDAIGERLLGRNPEGIGERLNEMNPDVIGERLLGRNPDGIGERVHEMIPNELMLNNNRLDENVPEARQRGHTLTPKEMNESIIKAAKSRNYSRVIHLIDHCVDLQYTDYLDNNLLHVVLCTWSWLYIGQEKRDEFLKCVIKLVEAGVDVNHMHADKETPIMLAARVGLYNIVKYLIDHCVDKQSTDPRQDNFLHLVLRRGRDDEQLLPCVIKLVEAGVDVNHLNEDQETPIIIAARKGLLNIVIYLIDHCVDIQCTDRDQDNVLHLVVYKLLEYYERDELLACVIRLVEAGVDVNHMNADKDTPIMLAAIVGLHNIVKYLIDHCLDKQSTDLYQNNILHIVLYNNMYRYGMNELLPCIIKLVEAGVDVNHINEYQDTPINCAADKGLYKVLIYLFTHCAHVDYVTINDTCVMHRVLYQMRFRIFEDVNQYSDDCIQIVRTLINMGVDVNKADIDGNTPLYHIAKGSFDTEFFRLQYDLIIALFYAGCNMNHRNKEGQTPLMYYIRKQAYTNIVKLLISLSDVNLTDINDDTACSYCVQYRLFNSTYIFKLYPVGVLMSPINGVKLFHQILTCKRLELLHYYMRLQLIVSGVTTEGENMLHLLARVKYDYSQDKFNWLFNKKLDINHRCSKTNTPIMIAALLLNSKYLELFTHHPRIQINAQNNQGHTALHLCIIGFTMVKDGLDTRQENDVVEDYCSHKYLMYMECVDILLAVGIDVNTQDGRGRTALMMAAMKNDRFLIRKLLNAGAMVNYEGKSALHHLDIYESVFDITFKLLVSAVDNMLLNLPCIIGNTLIQVALCFPRCWDPHTAVRFIKYLVGENCCLQSLVTSSAESSYNQIDMRELSSQERDELRKLLYLSGARENQIVAILNFDKENTNVEIDEMRRLLLLRGAHEDKIIQHLNSQVEDKDDQKVGFRSKRQQIFTNYCCNISLKSQCRRIIRQKLGLGIKEKVMDLDLPRELYDFLLLKDVLRPKDYYIDHIDDGCNDFDDDDGYGGYDIVKDRDDDHSQYNYQYFTLNTDDELKNEYKQFGQYPNGEHADTHL